MIRYNWEVIVKKTKNNPEKIINYFNNVFVAQGEMYEFLINNEWARDIQNESEEKQSYLLNIEGLIKNDLNGTKDEQIVYLDLASKRDMFTYYNTRGKVVFLPYWKVSDQYTDIDRLKLNRLLMIDENNIYFNYEGEF
jgi:hypothetical protein